MASNGKKMFSSQAEYSFRTTVGPLLLMFTTPPFVVAMWYVVCQLDGSFTSLINMFAEKGAMDGLAEMWPWPNMEAVRLLSVYAAFELALTMLVPGKTFRGPTTPQGETPVYKANGVQCFVLTHIVLYFTAFHFKLFRAGEVYDNLGPILVTLNFFSLFYCVLLYFKGIYFPSSKDHGLSGNPIFDYYWGTELYPRFLGVDLKQLTNCRLAMMGWSVLIVLYAAKQEELYGHVSNSMLVSVAIQLIYIAKFFYWETGYLSSLDIMHDRFGYYIAWGCHVWLPCIYTSQSMYLVKQPVQLHPLVAGAVFLLGSYCVWANYEADAQRQNVRKADGNMTIWGKKAEILRAKYTTKDGREHNSILLLSGWWSISRHFHYVPEILASFFWSCPGGFSHFAPFFYTIYLTILLCDRARRDDQRCQAKYGKYWDQYRARVPSMILPGIY